MSDIEDRPADDMAVDAPSGIEPRKTRRPCALRARADTLPALPTQRWLVTEPAKPARIHFGSIADQERARQAALKEKVRFASAHALGCSCRD